MPVRPTERREVGDAGLSPRARGRQPIVSRRHADGRPRAGGCFAPVSGAGAGSIL